MRAKTNIRLALIVVLALCFPQAVVATTYYVNPGESIQDAIDLASYGDTVQVAAGTYVEHGIELKNGVALIGAGESTTTIDGGGGSVVRAYNCDSNTILDGFTIANGGGSEMPLQAGGMTNANSSTIVTNCTFIGNFGVDGTAGGMHNGGGQPDYNQLHL